MTFAQGATITRSKGADPVGTLILDLLDRPERSTCESTCESTAHGRRADGRPR
jgi:hypothetical protein